MLELSGGYGVVDVGDEALVGCVEVWEMLNIGRWLKRMVMVWAS